MILFALCLLVFALPSSPSSPLYCSRFASPGLSAPSAPGLTRNLSPKCYLRMTKKFENNCILEPQAKKNMDLCANDTRFPSQNSTESSKINELSTKKLKSLVLSEKSLKSLISDRHPPPPRGGVQVASWRHILSNVSTQPDRFPMLTFLLAI